MNDDIITDLKQFITATVDQATASLKTELTTELTETLKNEITGVKAEINELRQEMHDGFTGVAEALEPVHDSLDDHERRITKLEQQAA